MKKYLTLMVAALLVLALAVGCGGKKDDQGNQGTPPKQEVTDKDKPGSDGPSINPVDGPKDGQDQPVSNTDDLPKTKQVVINMEGMEEKFTLHLYNHPLFATYYPGEDLVSDEVSSGEGDAVWFFANYGGNRNEEVYLQIYVLGKDNAATEEEFISIVAGEYGLAEEVGWQLERNHDPIYPWSLAEYFINLPGQQVSQGTLYLGQHDDRFFMITIHAPGEWAEGFYPRARQIIQELQWK